MASAKAQKCAECLATFSSSYNFGRHSCLSGTENRFPCGEDGCTKTFTRPDSVRKHVNSQHRRSSSADSRPALSEVNLLSEELSQVNTLTRQLNAIRLQKAEIVTDLRSETQAITTLRKRLQRKVKRRNCLVDRIKQLPALAPKRKAYEELSTRGTRRRHQEAWRYLRHASVFGKRCTVIAVLRMLVGQVSLPFVLRMVEQCTSKVKHAFRSSAKQRLRHRQRAALRSAPNFNRTVSKLFGGHQLMTKEAFNVSQTEDRAANKCDIPTTPMIPYNDVYREIRERTGLAAKLTPVADLVPGYTAPGYFRNDPEAVVCDLAQKCLQLFDGQVRWLQRTRVFHITIGFDAFPVNSLEVTTFTISVLEFGARFLHSPANRFLLFASHCKEDSVIAKVYAKILAQRLIDLADKPFNVRYWSSSQRAWKTEVVKFEPTAFLADQKGIAGMAGELSNAATNFSSIVEASKSVGQGVDTTSEGRLSGTDVAKFGRRVGFGHGEFKPRTYESRVTNFHQLQEAIERDQKELASNKRRKVAKKVATLCAELGTRQVEMPPLLQLVDHIAICSLHVILLSWMNFYYHLLDDLLPRIQAAVGATDLYTSFVQETAAIGCGKLAKKLFKRKPEGKEHPRLMGLDCHVLSRGFTRLTHLLERHLTTSCKRLMAELASFHFLGIQLRHISALISRHSTDADILADLRLTSTRYHALKVLLCDSAYLRQNDFTVGIVVPYQAELWHSRFNGLGLGSLSTQGVEHKHIEVKFALVGGQPQTKFQQIFLVDHMRNFYLPCILRAHTRNYSKAKPAVNYCPNMEPDSCDTCYYSCCKFCPNPSIKGLFLSLRQSVDAGMLVGVAKQMLA